jgi:hypothetical protein
MYCSGMQGRWGRKGTCTDVTRFRKIQRPVNSQTWCLHDQRLAIRFSCRSLILHRARFNGDLYNCCSIHILFHNNIPGQIICIRNICMNVMGKKGKAVPLQAWSLPRGFQEVKFPRLHDNSTGWW